MEEKIIIAHGEDLSTVNDMLKDGWSIKNMSACGYQWDKQRSCSCYIHLIRNMKPTNN